MDRNTAITELQNDIAEMEAFIAEEGDDFGQWTRILDEQRAYLARLLAGGPVEFFSGATVGGAL